MWVSAYTKLTSCSEVGMHHQSLCEKSSFNEELGLCCATCKDLSKYRFSLLMTLDVLRMLLLYTKQRQECG